MTISVGTWEGHCNCDILSSPSKLGPEERAEWNLCWQGVQLSRLSGPTFLGGCFLLCALDCMAQRALVVLLSVFHGGQSLPCHDFHFLKPFEFLLPQDQNHSLYLLTSGHQRDRKVPH